MATRKKTTLERHRAFVSEYIKHFDAQRAYEDCGCYKSKGRVAQAAASRLLTNDNVVSLINEAVAKRNSRTQIDQDRVVLELARTALFQLRSVMEWDDDEMRLLPSHELSDNDASAIAEVQIETTVYENENGVTTRTKKRIKAHDKLAALDKLARHVGMYAADNVLKLDMDDDIKGARDRISETLKQSRDRLAHEHSNGSAAKHIESAP